MARSGTAQLSRTARALALMASALAVSSFACSEKELKRPPPASAEGGDTGMARGMSSGSPGSPGLRVALPPGWLATSEGADALVAGPRGRVVIRISRSSLTKSPSAKSLSERFLRAAPSVVAQELARHEAENQVSWTAKLSGAGDDAKKGAWNVMLGAKAVGEDVFLCATLPGATDGEVKAAAKVCDDLGE